MRILNDPQPWWGLLPASPLSIVDLIENGSISAQAAAVAWWTVERGASAFVTAAPRQAGKTTLATALFPFLPEGARLYVTAGPHDSLTPPPGDGPLYVLVNELSDHMPLYVHGAAARRAFRILRHGGRLIGTLHADSAEEASALMTSEAGIPIEDVSRIDLYLVIRVSQEGDDILRRVAQLALRARQAQGRALRTMSSWSADTGQFAAEPGAAEALAAWANATQPEVERGLARRTDALQSLVRAAARTIDEVADSVRHVREVERPGRQPA
jgi:hypothetical protein